MAGDNWNESKFAWNDTVLRLGKEGFANNLFVDLDITVDNNDKKMRRIKVNIIQCRTIFYLSNFIPFFFFFLLIASQIDSPSLAFSPKVLSLGLNQKKVKSYYAFLVNVAELFGANRSQATKELRESVLFEIKLANASSLFVLFIYFPYNPCKIILIHISSMIIIIKKIIYMYTDIYKNRGGTGFGVLSQIDERQGTSVRVSLR